MEFVVDAERKLSIADARTAVKLDLWNAPQVRACPKRSVPPLQLTDCRG